MQIVCAAPKNYPENTIQMETPRNINVRDKFRRMFPKNLCYLPKGDSKEKTSGAWFLALLVVYVLFLMLGAAIFQALEYKVVRIHDTVDDPMWAEIKVAVANSFWSEEEKNKHLAWLKLSCPDTNVTLLDGVFSIDPEDFVNILETECKQLQSEHESEHLVNSWTFIDALYFSTTVITTVGYGHIFPTLPWGKVACIVYAIVGVPFSGILLLITSNFFGEKIYSVYCSKLSGDKQRSQVFIVCATIIYLAIGNVIFIFLPAAVFSFMEEWSYLDGVYYAFITITTIGFGDLVTGRNMDDGPKREAYQVVVIIWIILSLGYWVMVANFIVRAIKSKTWHESLRIHAKRMRDKRRNQRNNNPKVLSQRCLNSPNVELHLSSMQPVLQKIFEDELKV